MKFENNWKVKTLENLEKKYLGDSPIDTQLVTTCYALRKKPLQDFEIEDLRIMIGQNEGLDYLIPLAIDKLRFNILAEGDFFEGDLLKSVLKSNEKYWGNERANWLTICSLFDQNKQQISDSEISIEIIKDLFDSFSEFKTKFK